ILILVTSITGYVPISSKRAGRSFGIFPIFLEEPHRSVWSHPYRDITLLPWGKDGARSINDANVKVGRWLSHRAESRFNGRKTSGQEHRFCLTVAVSHCNACRSLPLLNDFRIQRLARRYTMTKMREFVFGQILQHQHSINGRRAAERCDRIPAQPFPCLFGIE